MKQLSIMCLIPKKISLQQKYTHHVLDVYDSNSFQQFLFCSGPQMNAYATVNTEMPSFSTIMTFDS